MAQVRSLAVFLFLKAVTIPVSHLFSGVSCQVWLVVRSNQYLTNDCHFLWGL